MSLLKTNSVQIGQSATATQNFTLSVPSSPDGTIKLDRGNAGDPTPTNIFSVSNSGVVTFTNNIVQPTPPVTIQVCSAYRNTNQTITENVWTKAQLNAEYFDTGSYFDSTTNYRFTPTVAGYYLVSGTFSLGTGGGWRAVAIYKNGSVARQLAIVPAYSTAYVQPSGTTILPMNGSTDYLELFVYHNAGASSQTLNYAEFNATYLRAL
jgi:hypothetical protein